ncbi:hypothetical protein D9613_002375 [Agrocybe pediades]|uniref:Uncharacterized protein n=1 Tax=Agrocybe pediades TaxID=84607 RepID=A0A8H4R3Y5_9AGAR|nr:hypothetical protein D9613_002375 [Agrocybe pediades]
MSATDTVTQLIFGPPSSIDIIKDLERSTLSTLSTLGPWYRHDFVQSYIGAIKLSLIAAQKEYDIAEEALELMEIIDELKYSEANRPEYSEADRQEHLQDMVNIAKQAEESAKKVNEAFRDVRNTLNKQLIDIARSDKALDKISSMLFSDRLEIGHGSLRVSSKHLVISYTAIRQKSIVQRWLVLKNAYLEYTYMISNIQNSDPAFSAEMERAHHEELQYRKAVSPSRSRAKVIDHPVPRPPVVQVDLPVPTLPTFLDDLAKSTSDSLVVLRPWLQGNHTPPTPALSCIKKQAQSYVDAIKQIVFASRHGHDIAKEVLVFFNNVNDPKYSKNLSGIVNKARWGEDNTKKAYGAFRDVRKNLKKLFADCRDDAASLRSDTNPNTISNLLTDLENGASVLEDLSSCISQYIKWWTELGMSYRSLSASSERLVINDASFHKKADIQKWEELKKAFVEYTVMDAQIKELEDSDPAFTAEMEETCQE